MSWRLTRIKQEAAQAAFLFTTSRAAEVDLPDGRWVRFFDFALPPGYNYDKTDILILLPPSYPQTPPDWFYLDQGLRRYDGSPPHVFDRLSSHPPVMEGWAVGSLHIKTWNPSTDLFSGHSLLSVCGLIEDAFRRWLHQRAPES